MKGMKAGHGGHQDKERLNNQGCGACGEPVFVDFIKPKHFQPSLSHVTCEKCKSRFLYKIEVKKMLDANGQEFPYTITRKVSELTKEGLHAYQMRKINKANETKDAKGTGATETPEQRKTRSFADRMGGG